MKTMFAIGMIATLALVGLAAADYITVPGSELGANDVYVTDGGQAWEETGACADLQTEDVDCDGDGEIDVGTADSQLI